MPPTLVPTALAALAALLPPLAPQEGLRTRRSKEAIVKSNTSKEVAEAVGRRIDNFCEVFGEFYEGLGLERKADNMVSARLFDTYEEYQRHFQRTSGSEDPPLAYFSPSMNAIVLYNDEADITLRQTLFHEAQHQFLNRFTNDAPKWLNEGLSEYFEGWRMSPEGELVEKRVNLYDLKLLQDWLKKEQTLAPRALAAFDAKQFDEFKKDHPELHPYLHYVTAWGMVYYSLELGAETGDRERLVNYLRALNQKGPRAVFEMDDWDAFEARWKEAILALEPRPVDVADHLLLATGHRQSNEWEAAAKLYEAAHALDPNAPGAAYWVGFCKKRTGDYEGALSWFEKARTHNPKNPMVPFQMARIVLGIDKKGAKGDPVKALALAEDAAKLAGDSPGVLELLARCQAAAGDGAAASKTVKRILKLVEEDAEKQYYEKLEKELKGK